MSMGAIKVYTIINNDQANTHYVFIQWSMSFMQITDDYYT